MSNSNLIIEKPSNYDEMIEVARKLSSKSTFMRVDLYDINGKVYFGEITFYPSSGFVKFKDKKMDEHFGSLIRL